MTVHKITSPNPKYDGVTGDCRFVNGVGYTSNPVLLSYFKAMGYTIEKEKETKTKDKEEKEKETKTKDKEESEE